MLVKESFIFKYDEIKSYFYNFIAENSEALNDSDFRDDLHHHAFNTDYYIIGTYKAKKWLGDKAFDVINIIQGWEEDRFGESQFDISDPEKVVNMYAYIVGEEIVAKWLEDNPLEEEIK
tara:strand:+ start:326 stop:682 length:357 start_codon:yes stop_codon:yes gene_type:complete